MTSAENKANESNDCSKKKEISLKRKSSIFASIKFDNLNEQNKDIINKTISSINVVVDIYNDN